MTPVISIPLRISLRIFDKKFETTPMEYIEYIHEKSKISCQTPFQKNRTRTVRKNIRRAKYCQILLSGLP
jgi:hypothetical protein